MRTNPKRNALGRRHVLVLLGLLLALAVFAPTVIAATSEITPEEYYRVNKLLRHVAPTNFQETVSTGRRLVFFGSSGCGHCRQFTPVWWKAQQRSDAIGSSLRLYKAECFGRAEDEDLCQDLGVTRYPTIRLYVDGKHVEDYKDAKLLDPLNGYIDAQLAAIAGSAGSSKAGEKSKPDPRPPAETPVARPAVAVGEIKRDDQRTKDALEFTLAQLREIAASGTRPQAHINPDGQLMHLTDATFPIMTNNTPWFIMFHAPWCTFCKQLKPVFEDLAPSLRGQVNLGAVDCTSEGTTCRSFGIRGYPTLKYMHLPSHVAEYKGARSFDALREYARDFTSRPAFTVVKASEIQHVLDRNEVAFWLLVQSETVDRTQLETFLDVATSMRHDARFYVTPDPAARDILNVQPPSSSTGARDPVLLVTKDNGQLTIPLPSSSLASRQTISTFVKSNRHPRVLHLDADNQEEVLGGDAVVVIAVIDPADPKKHAVLKALRDATFGWENQARTENLHEDLVVFTWLDGVKWSAYVERVYGVTEQQVPLIIIADPKEDTYYDVDNGGRAIAFEKAALLQTINEVLEGTAKPKFTAGLLGRLVYSVSRWASGTLAFVKHHGLFVICLVIVGVMAYVYGGVPGLRPTIDPKAE
ncbi:hypothetical protein HKX48_004287 [Thoreauomyces humboldtii]|nr:hypothetical protein HKX48_004287 [Thoreauomyces humboldtii]